jgi:formylglycine-generating enzyme required for sulfatase activity
MNPATKLWEFYHFLSAWEGDDDPADLAIPQHLTTDGARGRVGDIVVTEATGIVLVLLPGGSFRMGAQRTAEATWEGDGDEEPAHAVTLAPFFLARHELTQAQWRRLTGLEPSLYRPGVPGTGSAAGSITLTHPVERVSWKDCERWLRRHGLVLPTEAQWEYGCRAGTATPWWSGAESTSLDAVANLADRTASEAGATWPEVLESPPALRDGFVVHGPVGSLRANGFGLHDVHGNVWEWCRDCYGSYNNPPRSGDGLRGCAAADDPRVQRGGCFVNGPRAARSPSREAAPPDNRDDGVGVRAARRLDE